jgi:hypothetical protein
VLEEGRAVGADVQPAIETVCACRPRMLLHECRQRRQTSVRFDFSLGSVDHIFMMLEGDLAC